MPDIFAIYDPEGLGGVEVLLNRAETLLRTRSDQTIRRHVGNTFAAINVLKPFSFAGDQPFFHNDQVLFIDGKVFEDRPFPEVIQRLFTRDPHGLLSVNGQYNALIYCPKNNDIRVITDRLGTRPIYHARLGSRHIISSEIKAIQAAFSRPFTISPVGLLELFAFGHNLGEKTIFGEVVVLPPGSVVNVGKGGVRYTSYYHFGYRQLDTNVSAWEWGEAISSCLKRTIPKYLVGQTRKSISLSGGLDSRILAGAVGSTGFRPNAYTFGNAESRDVLSAQDIARHLQFRHHALEFPKGYLASVLAPVVSRTECASPFFHTTSPIFHDLLAEHTDVILVGFGGPLSGSQIYRRLLGLNQGRDLVSYMFHRHLCSTPQDIARLFQPSFFKQHWANTVDAFHASVSNIEENTAVDTSEVWGMLNRQRRFTFAAPKVDRGQFEVVSPMLDNEFVDLMTTLPVRVRWKQLAYRYAIVDGFPKLRDVPWAKTGRKVPVGRAAFWVEETARVGARIIDRFPNFPRSGRRIEKDKYRSVADDIRNDEALISKYLGPYMDSRILPADIFSYEGIEQVVQRHMKGEDLSHLIATVLTIACYLSISESGFLIAP